MVHNCQEYSQQLRCESIQKGLIDDHTEQLEVCIVKLETCKRGMQGDTLAEGFERNCSIIASQMVIRSCSQF